jgi:hypothetical protein
MIALLCAEKTINCAYVTVVPSVDQSTLYNKTCNFITSEWLVTNCNHHGNGRTCNNLISTISSSNAYCGLFLRRKSWPDRTEFQGSATLISTSHLRHYWTFAKRLFHCNSVACFIHSILTTYSTHFRALFWFQFVVYLMVLFKWLR